jgi:hypothetical protein
MGVPMGSVMLSSDWSTALLGTRGCGIIRQRHCAGCTGWCIRAARQPAGVDERTGRHDVGALHGPAQLTHIARPAVCRQLRQRRRREVALLAFPVADGGQEMFDQEVHVGQPVAQRRKLQWEHVQAVQQVFAQLAHGHGLVRQPVRGRRFRSRSGSAKSPRSSPPGRGVGGAG